MVRCHRVVQRPELGPATGRFMAPFFRVVAGRRVMRWRNGLMVVQLALSALLLVGAGLMIKSLVKLNQVSLGFDPSGVIAVRTPAMICHARLESVPPNDSASRR